MNENNIADKIIFLGLLVISLCLFNFGGSGVSKDASFISANIFFCTSVLIL